MVIPRSPSGLPVASPKSELATVRGRALVPSPLALRVAEMLPSLGAFLDDTTLEVSLEALLDTLAWVTRRVSGFPAHYGDVSDAGSRGDSPRRRT